MKRKEKLNNIKLEMKIKKKLAHYYNHLSARLNFTIISMPGY
jgi:hypothetical protein